MIQRNRKETRDLLYIDDFTEALELVILKGESRQIYHIGTQSEISISDLAIEISQFFRKSIKFMYTPLLSGSTQRRCPDINKLLSLGFKPNVSIKEGLQKVIPWYKNNINLMEKLN